jgi:hypothetical protein
VDLWFWGSFLFSYFENFRLNFIIDIASFFGTMHPTFYLFEMIRQTWGLLLPALLGLWLLWRGAWPFGLAVLVGLAAFHVPGHKEFRFIIWVLPFVFIALSAALVTIVGLSRYRPGLRRAAIGGLAMWLTLATGAQLWQLYGPPGSQTRHRAELWQAFHALSRERDVNALKILTPDVPWSWTPGYYGLGKPVPVYFWGWQEPCRDAGCRARVTPASHLVTGPGISVRRGYGLLQEFGAYRIWQADNAPAAEDFDDYDPRVPVPRPLTEVPPNPRLKVWPLLPN